ncbi:hypothetical protein GOODEAATRI_017168, partial [Goodea atripinnis]
MSSLLQASTNLEATRIQIYKDVMSCLLAGLRSQGHVSAQAQQRLLSVVHGQLLGMEGRLKEERGARMAALAGQCNLETHEEMEAEHRRQAAEKAQAERLWRGASALLQGQERLHQDGKAALRTLSCTRESLQKGMEQELQEQKELRAHWRDFF